MGHFSLPESRKRVRVRSPDLQACTQHGTCLQQAPMPSLLRRDFMPNQAQFQGTVKKLDQALPCGTF